MKLNHLIIVLFFIQTQVIAACVSVGSGDWDDPNTWVCNGVPGVPGCGDTITITAGHTVTIRNQQNYSEPGCGTPMFVVVNGTLDFPVNGPKLQLPCNSGFIINSGGSLSASAPAGGGSANFLEICGTVYWRKADGTQTGPISYGAPLPINLVYFDALVIEKTVLLTWVTASEINNDYFTIERSVDTKIWETVLIINGAGNSSQIIEYTETDFNPISGVSYYRIKQTDFDGRFEYFNIVPVKYNTSIEEDEINIFPNPANQGGNISINHNFNSTDKVLVVLRDLQGKEFYSKVHIKINKDELVGVPIDYEIPKGIYFIVATSENKIHSKKLIIK
ncbi:MAG: T9SS type A sorting domain-containing protein [Flavobacteriales bacterium]|nr:T9SS type A sorting domain-containing protein [Flavobacteriales bacterium]